LRRSLFGNKLDVSERDAEALHGAAGSKEVERVLDVYRTFLPKRSACWDPRNRGNAAILTELERRVVALLRARDRLPLGSATVLDVGCGYGHFVGLFQDLGADPANLHGVDLLPERIEAACRRRPAIAFRTGNAAELPYEDHSFDLVLLFSVMTSILDPAVRAAVASETRRVLRPGGAILLYDFRFDSPRNPHVRGLRRPEVERVFPDLVRSFETLTVAPPLARRLGPFTTTLYPMLRRVPVLRTHFLCLLEHRRDPSADELS
jgi:SAM-dependent methyltransferase